VRRTKIIATLGPASEDSATLESIIKAGADVLRLNFAHADPQTHAAAARRARETAARNGRIIGLLGDLPGPKIRTGSIASAEITLQPGDRLHLGTSQHAGGIAIPTSIDIAPLVAPGDEVFLADGQIVLEVLDVESENVHAEVVRGGVLRSGKGMHIPRAEMKVDPFSKRDEDALRAALAIGVDMIGVSFVRTVDDIERVKRLLPEGSGTPGVIAKIETRAAVDNLEAIIAAADGVMVARGDLGIQLPFREVPILQKTIIKACNESGTPVITATQMLESMTHSLLPTRAEVSDIANAVLDGTDAVMLSEETAVGDYPGDAVRVMDEIAVEAENRKTSAARIVPQEDAISWAVARAAVEAADELGVAAILCPTRSGATARIVAAFRPRMPVLAIDDNIETLQALTAVWGVVPFQVPFLEDEDVARHGIDRALDAARSSGVAAPGDLVTLVAGSSVHRAAATDVVRVLRL
jgi:pyruvate kinase